MYQRYTDAHVLTVRLLTLAGLSDYEIGRRLKIPRSTVNNWRRRRGWPQFSVTRHRFTAGDPATYAYLLGVYLGDGHLVRCSRNGWRLGIYCDGRYPLILDEIKNAIGACVPNVNVCLNTASGGNGVALFASSRLWPAAFPQHGPGRKHQRPIELEPWQLKITHRFPQSLLRGLIHSDGCRCVNRFRTRLPSGRVAEYAYPRYFFSNLSADIRRLFCEACERLGVRWTLSNPRNVSVSHRASVAILEEIVGPKA